MKKLKSLGSSLSRFKEQDENLGVAAQSHPLPFTGQRPQWEL